MKFKVKRNFSDYLYFIQSYIQEISRYGGLVVNLKLHNFF